MKQGGRAAAAVLLCLFLLLAWTVPLRAAGAEPGADFYVKAVIPDNQRNPDAAYFDLWMQPEQEQTLRVDIVNREDEEITVRVETVTASTNRNGVINYSTTGIYDTSMEYAFAEIAKPLEPELIIPPNASRQAQIEVSMPEEPFSGMLLGSVRVTKVLGEDELESELGIVNQFSYTVGVRLTEQEDEMDPEFFLGDVGGATVNYKAAIVANVRNTAPVIARDVSVASRVFAKGEQAPLIEKRQEAVEMAPNSVFPMSLVDEEGYGFPQGEYIAVVDLEFEGQTWGFEREFSIVAQDAAAINGAALNQTQNQQTVPEQATSAWPAIGIALGCAAAGAIVAIKVLGRVKSTNE